MNSQFALLRKECQIGCQQNVQVKKFLHHCKARLPAIFENECE